MSAPYPRRLTEEERTAIEEYGRRDTQVLKKHKRESRLLDILSGLMYALGLVLVHAMVAERHFDWEYAGVACTLFGIGILCTWRSTRLRDAAEDALSLSPFEAYLRLGEWEGEADHQAAQKVACELELNEIIAQREVEIERLKNQVNEAVVEFAAWATLLGDTHTGTLGFSRSVSSELDHPPHQRRPDAELLAEIDKEFNQVLENLVTALMSRCGTLFGHVPDYGFFDVFELQKAECVQLARRTIGHPEEHGRSWPIRAGHIGEAVLLGQLVYKNISPEDRDLRREPNSRPTDPQYFQSAIYAPIPAIDRKPHNVYGVVVVTSSTLNGLNLVHATLVQTLAHSIAGAFITRQRAYKRLGERKNLYDIRTARSRAEAGNESATS
jgi:hypothetical protein